MVDVGGIVVRRQDRSEEIAGAVANFAQERCLHVIAGPITQDRDRPAILQSDSGHVDRVGGSVLTERAFAAPVKPAAAEAAGMIDLPDLLTKMSQRRGLNDLPLPQGERSRNWAGGNKAGRQIADWLPPLGKDSNPILEAALQLGAGARKRGSIAKICCGQQRIALTASVRQRGQLHPRERADRVGKSEFSPRKPFGMLAHEALIFAPAE